MSDFRYFEAPAYYRPAAGDPPVVFLAGGITGCPRWHDEAIRLLHATGLDMVVLNPNRVNFPIGDPTAGREQVWWEQHHLLLPQTVTMMWFPASDRTVTVQPIAMFELGQCLNPATLAVGRRVVVGADPGYPRAVDVALMMAYHRPDEPVYSTLEELVSATAAVVRVGGVGRCFYVDEDGDGELTLWTGDPHRPDKVATKTELDWMDGALWPLITTVLAPTHLEGTSNE